MRRGQLWIVAAAAAALAGCAAQAKQTPAVVESEAARQVAAEAVDEGASSAEALSKSEQVEPPR